MREALGRFGREFLECFERVNRANEALRNVTTLPMSLSTITCTGVLSRAELPVDDMRLAAELVAELGGEAEFEVDCDEAKYNKSKRFRYQLPLKRNGKSLKLFYNGSVHATGCTSPLEFLDMVDCLSGFMRQMGNLEAWLVSFDIQLINTLFLVAHPGTKKPMTIAPGALLRILGRGQQPAEFDTERHPSVKIPLLLDGAKVATVCVFQTGSVSIMGAKRPSHVAAAYEMVVAHIDAHAAQLCLPDAAARMRTTTAKQGLVLVQGYPFNLFSCCQGC